MMLARTGVGRIVSCARQNVMPVLCVPWVAVSVSKERRNNAEVFGVVDQMVSSDVCSRSAWIYA